MDRPGYYDDETRKLVVEKLLDDAMDWLRRDGGEHNVDEVRVELLDALSFSYDGYEIAKRLDDYAYWGGIDFDLVEILDGARFYVYEAYRERLIEWVKAYNIKPQYDVGVRVEFTCRGETCEGEIVRVEEEVGQYLIYCEGLGRVRVYIDYEKVN